VHNLELERFRESIYGELYETDLHRYKKKEIELLENLIEKRDRHLQKSIDHIAKARRKQIVIFLDNADQRTYEIQQNALIIAQEIAENWLATVFVALRPETFHKSMRSGALSGYHPKAFTISPPRIDRVIHKRIAFGLKLASGQIPLSFLEGTTVHFRNLEVLL